jgi:hypothetical protein
MNFGFRISNCGFGKGVLIRARECSRRLASLECAGSSRGYVLYQALGQSKKPGFSVYGGAVPRASPKDLSLLAILLPLYESGNRSFLAMWRT